MVLPLAGISLAFESVADSTMSSYRIYWQECGLCAAWQLTRNVLGSVFWRALYTAHLHLPLARGATFAPPEPCILAGDHEDVSRGGHNRVNDSTAS